MKRRIAYRNINQFIFADNSKEKKDAKEPKISTLKKKDKLEDVMKLMEEENLHEIEVTDGPFHLKLVRQSKTPMVTQFVGPSTAGAAKPKQSEPEKGIAIKAPLAGVYYRAPSPKSPPFIKEGGTIAPGQTLGIIEAMKVMNEVKAEISGRVVKILIENGKPVEANQTMILVEPV